MTQDHLLNPHLNLNLQDLSPLLELLHKELLERSKGQVTNFLPYTELKKKIIEFERSLSSKELNSYEKIQKILQLYLRYSVHTNHPHFYNQLWSGQSIPALLGDCLSVLTNTSTATFETAPVATTIENILLPHFLKDFDFSDGEGQFVPGGSYSNMMAVLMARNECVKNAKTDGLFSNQPLSLFVSEEAHYSIDKAANIVGIGIHSLVKVKCNTKGEMLSTELEIKIKESQKEGKMPFLIIATAGTTVRGSFDPILEISAIAKKNNIWLHVDGAWGGAIKYSKSHRHLIDGLSKVNSFSIDFHKMLGLPLMCSLFMSRPRGLFQRNFSSGDPSYIFHEHDEEEQLNLSAHSLQCGRRNDVTKLWLEWLLHGPSTWERNIHTYLKLAKKAEEIIQNSPYLELQSERIINNICFRFVHPKIKNLNEFNLILRNKLYHENIALVNYAFLNTTKDLTIRLVLTSIHQTEESVASFFQVLIQKALEILEQ